MHANPQAPGVFDESEVNEDLLELQRSGHKVILPLGSPSAESGTSDEHTARLGLAAVPCDSGEQSRASVSWETLLDLADLERRGIPVLWPRGWGAAVVEGACGRS